MPWSCLDTTFLTAAWPDLLAFLQRPLPHFPFYPVSVPSPIPDSTQILYPSLCTALAKTHPPLPFLHHLLLSVGKLFMALHCPRQAPVPKYLRSVRAWLGLAGEPGPNPDIPCEQVAQPCRWKTYVERENSCWPPNSLCGYSHGLCSSEGHFSPVLGNCACFEKSCRQGASWSAHTAIWIPIRKSPGLRARRCKKVLVLFHVSQLQSKIRVRFDFPLPLLILGRILLVCTPFTPPWIQQV